MKEYRELKEATETGGEGGEREVRKTFILFEE